MLTFIGTFLVNMRVLDGRPVTATVDEEKSFSVRPCRSVQSTSSSCFALRLLNAEDFTLARCREYSIGAKGLRFSVWRPYTESNQILGLQREVALLFCRCKLASERLRVPPSHSSSSRVSFRRVRHLSAVASPPQPTSSDALFLRLFSPANCGLLTKASGLQTTSEVGCEVKE